MLQGICSDHCLLSLKSDGFSAVFGHFAQPCCVNVLDILHIFLFLLAEAKY